MLRMNTRYGSHLHRAQCLEWEMDVYPVIMQEEVCSPMGAWLGNLNLVMESILEVFKHSLPATWRNSLGNDLIRARTGVRQVRHFSQVQSLRGHKRTQ